MSPSLPTRKSRLIVFNRVCRRVQLNPWVRRKWCLYKRVAETLEIDSESSRLKSSARKSKQPFHQQVKTPGRGMPRTNNEWHCMPRIGVTSLSSTVTICRRFRNAKEEEVPRLNGQPKNREWCRHLGQRICRWAQSRDFRRRFREALAASVDSTLLPVINWLSMTCHLMDRQTTRICSLARKVYYHRDRDPQFRKGKRRQRRISKIKRCCSLLSSMLTATSTARRCLLKTWMFKAGKLSSCLWIWKIRTQSTWCPRRAVSTQTS